MTIKPIETIYNGSRMRSRLEARWAVFFDTLGITWEYEKEGFDLDGLYYLPDFWLSELQYWIEVKPMPPDDVEKEKAKRLTVASRYPVYFHMDIPRQETTKTWIGQDENGWVRKYGEPFIPALMGYIPSTDEKDMCVFYGDKRYEPLRWVVCPICNKKEIATGLCSCDCIKNRYILLKKWWEEIHEKGYLDLRDSFHALYLSIAHNHSTTPCLIEAYTAARQARFEHGENGR